MHMSKVERQWYDFLIKQGATKEKAKKEILADRRLSKKVKKAIKKEMPNLDIE